MKKPLTYEDTVAVIGAGPAGMMAAITAAKSGKKTFLIEKNPMPGKKLRITGKGRCNLTNACSAEEVLQNIPKNSKFLFGSVSRFKPDDVMDFFKGLGVGLKVERGNRVFPVSDKASDIVSALLSELKRLNVKVIRAKALELFISDGRAKAVITDNETVYCDYMILSTGGISYPLTGSTGDGYKMALAAGHSVTKLTPSLVPLKSDNEICATLMGLSLKNVAISVFESGRKIYGDFGEMIFTHFGLSGPIILSASAHMRQYETQKYEIYIDLKPSLAEDVLDSRLIRDFKKYSNHVFKNSLNDLLPKKMIPEVVRLSGIPGDKKVNSVTQSERKRLLSIIKNIKIEITGPASIDEAIVTSGGVCVTEINPKTMESKIVKGLYFAGEIIDVDAYTGGYNLQIAWSTGYTAGLLM